MTRRFRPLRTLAATAFALLAGVGAASSAPSLLVDLDSGDVLEATE